MNETVEFGNDLLGLDRLAVGESLQKVGDLIPATASLFEMDLMAGRKTEQVLDQAREMLMLRNLKSMAEVDSLKRTADSLKQQTEKLEEVAQRDPLTGVYNRAFLDEFLAAEFAAASEHGWPVSIAFADLDHFKSVNDNHGHQAGDAILIATAELLRANTRDEDIIARYGGEEFIVVLPGIGADGVKVVCQRIVRAFQNTHHDVGGGQQLAVTISIGTATHGGAENFIGIDDFVKAADEALYTAKRQGRNRTVRYDDRLRAVGE